MAGAIVGMGAFAESEADDFGRLVAEDFLELGADEGVVALGVNDEDQVRETVDQAAGEFLLLVKLLFDGAALGDVHQRALITNDAAAGVADGGSGVEAIDGLAILAAEGDFAALGAGLAIDFASEGGALGFVNENFGDFLGEELFLGAVAEHVDERGIDLEDFVLGRDDVDAFLQSFEEFGEAGLAALHGGDVAGEDGDAVDFVAADHGVRDAIEEVNHVALLEADLNDAGPDAALEESGLAAFENFDGMPVGVLEEVGEAAPDDFLKGLAEEIGEAAVYSANFAVESHGEKDVVERIDQVAEALLGLRNHGEKLVKLLVAGERGVFLVEAADQTSEFGDFLGLFPDVYAEKRDEDNEANGQGLRDTSFRCGANPRISRQRRRSSGREQRK